MATKNIFKRTVLSVTMMLTALCTNALINGGTITLKVGETYSVDASYGGGLTQTGSWSKSNSTFTIVSRGNKSCTISGNQVGTGTLYYDGVAGSYDVNYYWTVNVVSNSDNNGTNNNGGETIGDSSGETSENWATLGNYSLAWYNSSQSEFIISNNRELAGVAYLVNNGYTNFEGKTIKISNDIDLKGIAWIPIGLTSKNAFKGVFDGQGHTISGVSIREYNENQSYFGFFGYIYKATVSNVVLQGMVNVVNPVVSSSSKLDHYIGGLAAYTSSYSTIENCKCEMNVEYSRNAQPSGTVNKIYIGGLLGYNSCDTVRCCSHIGNVRCTQTTPTSGTSYNIGTPNVGGLVGYNNSGTIEYSENISSVIYCEVPRNAKDSGQGRVRIGGISGDGYGTIQYCRNICSFDINHNGYINSSAVMFIYIGGIAGVASTPTVTNCYTSVSNITVTTSTNSTYEIQYGGICGNEYIGTAANFSNSNVSINKSYIKKFNGSTSFTSSQMQTSAFLEELNLYSGGTVWGQRVGEYPHILKLEESMKSTGINELPYENEVENFTGTDIPANAIIYNLSGQKITNRVNLKKGIYIVNGKKVVIK